MHAITKSTSWHFWTVLIFFRLCKCTCWSASTLFRWSGLYQESYGREKQTYFSMLYTEVEVRRRLICPCCRQRYEREDLLVHVVYRGRSEKKTYLSMLYTEVSSSASCLSVGRLVLGLIMGFCKIKWFFSNRRLHWHISIKCLLTFSHKQQICSRQLWKNLGKIWKISLKESKSIE